MLDYTTKKLSRGIFISIEGMDGCGKSTQTRKLKKILEQQGLPVAITKEPCRSVIGKQLNKILKSERLSPKIELMLFMAARYDHIQTVILPKLKQNICVISDRFIDSTLCYQGILGKIDIKWIQDLHNSVCGIWPDVTYLLDINPVTVVDRIKNRPVKHFYDSMPLKQQTVIREGFLHIATLFPERIMVVDANKFGKTTSIIVEHLMRKLAKI
ncbi:dTMP kinase [Candidatus Sneabacter namystus]|uniref:Thymidylate kinase n=1 Tax=Candidatus Sneabacter namystus TaxID=2601646 RepID=A0A5C0UIR7_9RICK|nr:dTMP kinase [Candidatus Sneabacter namystus]QEK39689.1 dTMP kinase [Candidatus Sneabacter namystus]